MTQGEQPIFYFSQKLSQAEKNYAHLAIKQWWYAFTVITDHAPLEWLHTDMKDNSSDGWNPHRENS